MIKNLIFFSYAILLLYFTVKSRSKEAFVPIFLTLVLIFLVPHQGAFASSKSPYESGYDHGCDDAGISNPSDRYINQPEKGPSFHTSEFMNGYYTGVNSCGDSNMGGTYNEQPQQSRSNGGFKEGLNECKDLYSDITGMSDIIDTGIGLGCIAAGGLNELSNQ
jgi:hypothetical protein